jgi:hypothetical protein
MTTHKPTDQDKKEGTGETTVREAGEKVRELVEKGKEREPGKELRDEGDE